MMTDEKVRGFYEFMMNYFDEFSRVSDEFNKKVIQITESKQVNNQNLKG